MSINIRPELERRLLARAEAEGLSIEAYVERLMQPERQAEEDIERLALEGFDSGNPIQVGPEYWEEKHRRLEERLKMTGTR